MRRTAAQLAIDNLLSARRSRARATAAAEADAVPRGAEQVRNGSALKRRRDAGGMRKSGDGYAAGWRRLSAHQVKRLVSILT
mmetsp:Transcript_12018/g.39560  ORF Transcript_12018/g.39560 Transcript_12018/m.39560 type:complete len:82 (+) Transcript_12018:392-637(+)